MKKMFINSLLLALPVSAVAGGSPWLPAPETTNAQLSYVYQTADELWAGETSSNLPASRKQNTYWLSLQHGYSDDLAFDLQVGYSEATFAPESREGGLADSSIGATWRVNDEFFSDNELPSIAVRLGAIIEGDYDTGKISAIGDGASGAEAELLVGKVLGDSFALSGSAGFRYRSSNTPNETTFSLNAAYILTETLSASVGYQYIDSKGNLDIGAAGFSFDRFDEVEEDVEFINLGVSYALTERLNINVSHGAVIDGRNSGKNDVSAITFGTSF